MTRDWLYIKELYGTVQRELTSSTRLTMAGLISPKPVSYLQHVPPYNPYQRNLPAAGYSETPPIPSTLSHSIPPGQFVGSGLGTTPDLREDATIYALIIDLLDPNTRESALLELSKKREQYDDLALVLWHSFGIFAFPLLISILSDTHTRGIMPALLQEIVSVYPLLSPPNLTAQISNRVCNALALLQCVASHSGTRQLFLSGAQPFVGDPIFIVSDGDAAHIPLFLYPFLNTTSKTRPFEYLRLTSLGVIGALVKVIQAFSRLCVISAHAFIVTAK
jgi:CCR4-NOT transcription complex subunit 9